MYIAVFQGWQQTTFSFWSTSEEAWHWIDMQIGIETKHGNIKFAEYHVFKGTEEQRSNAQGEA